MKKRIFALIFIAIILFTAIVLTGCSNDKTGKGLSITEFIDKRVAQFTNNPEVYCRYNMKSFILTKEQWESIRILFDEKNWTELESYQLSERSTETGFMSFHSVADTIAFDSIELIVSTMDIIDDTTIKNRYYTINKETVEAIEAQVAIYANAYVPPTDSDNKGG